MTQTTCVGGRTSAPMPWGPKPRQMSIATACTVLARRLWPARCLRGVRSGMTLNYVIWCFRDKTGEALKVFKLCPCAWVQLLFAPRRGARRREGRLCIFLMLDHRDGLHSLQLRAQHLLRPQCVWVSSGLPLRCPVPGVGGSCSPVRPTPLLPPPLARRALPSLVVFPLRLLLMHIPEPPGALPLRGVAAGWG